MNDCTTSSWYVVNSVIFPPNINFGFWCVVVPKIRAGLQDNVTVKGGISSDGFDIFDKGNKIFFYGNAFVILK